MASEKKYSHIFAGEVGEVYSVVPEFAGSSVSKGGTMRGKVVFIPKNRRYAVLAFKGITGTSREAFWPEDLQQCNILFHLK